MFFYSSDLRRNKGHIDNEYLTLEMYSRKTRRPYQGVGDWCAGEPGTG
jgi:hypothetical protein